MNVKFDGMHNEHPTNELRGTVIPQGTLSCPSGNSPCAPAGQARPVRFEAKTNQIYRMKKILNPT